MCAVQDHWINTVGWTSLHQSTLAEPGVCPRMKNVLTLWPLFQTTLMGGEGYPNIWLELPVVQWVPGAPQLSVYALIKPGSIFSVPSGYVNEDSNSLLSSWGWANLIVFLCTSPLIVLLTLHWTCSSMSLYSHEKPRPGHWTSGSVWQVPD